MEDGASIVNLPEDPATLKSMIATLMRERDEFSRRCEATLRERDEAACQRDQAAGAHHALRLRVDELELIRLRLEMQLLKYKKWMYGPRADRLATLGEVAQMLLGFGGGLDTRPLTTDDADGVTAADQEESKDHTTPPHPRRVKRGKGRRALANFGHLPVTRHEHDLPEAEKPCPCCGTMREKIGEESSWQIEFIPGRFERIEHVRFKYACGHCEQSASPDGPQIRRADRPDAGIDRGLAGPGLLAFVVTSKYADYTPLYRLEDIFQRGGFEIARSTMSLWCRDVAELVGPLYGRMVDRVLRSRVIGTDDTIMPMLCPGAGRTRKARMWVYVGDDANPYNVFDFTLSRSRDGPSEFLKGYRGVLLADAYGGYDGIVVGNQITRAGCWAHARRKFVDAEVAHPAIAAGAVGIIKKLYAIEERGKTLDGASRGALRRVESAPILAAFRETLFTWRDQLLPKHPMALAVAYTLNQWDELNVFLRDGAVPADNNTSEREMKRIVLNRKNSLFVGHERAGRTAAILSSLTSTCRRHDIDPQRYLTQLLTNLPATPLSQLDRWLPDEWKRRDAPPPA